MNAKRPRKSAGQPDRSGKMSERENRGTTAGVEQAGEVSQFEIPGRLRAGAELRLLFTITQAISESEDIRSALGAALQYVCEATGWDYGEAWIPRPDGAALERSPAWYRGTSDLDGFRTSSERFTFSPGVGLPGRVWLSRQPEWVQDISANSANPRAQLAKTVGLNAALGVPILANERVLAVLVFFMFHRREEDRRLIEIVSTVANQLGSLIQRKRAEQELRESEQRFRALVQNSPDAVVSADSHGNVIYFSSGAERIFGYPAADMVGRPLTELMPERFHVAHREGLRRFLATGEAHVIGKTIELAGKRKDGSEFPVELALATWRTGDEIFFTGIIRDITERKLIEEELRKARDESEMRVQERTVELISANRALQDEIAERTRIAEEVKARVRQQAAVVQLGRRALAGAELSALMAEACTLIAETLDVKFCKVLELLRGGHGLLLRAGVGWKEGLVGRAEVSAFESQAGYTLRSSASVIVEDLRTEKRFSGPPLLHEHGVISGVSVIIRGADRPFGVLGAYTAKRRDFSTDDVYFLESMANILSEAIEHRKAEKEIQHGAAWLQNLIAATQDAVVSIDRQGRIVLFNAAAEAIFGYSRSEVEGKRINMLMPEPYKSEHDSYIARYEATGERRAIGRIRTVSARRKDGEVFPIELSVAEVAAEREVRYAAFIRDISDKTKLQEKLVENERLAAVGAMSAVLAHEIGNPLNGMSMTLQLFERRLEKAGDVDDGSRSSIQKLKDEIRRLNALVQEFTSFSRREKYSLKPVSLAAVAGDVFSMQAEDYAARGIRVEQVFPPDLPTVLADRDRLKQALLNLCKNAAEAMSGGGTLTLRAYPSGNEVSLEIIDTGTGIPDGLDIFSPFTTTKASGTGLGLMVVRQVIAAHGGTISYSSEPGRGTTFRISLQASPP